MKKIIELASIMLLVSSCGLFKKKSKIVQSQTAGVVTAMQSDSQYDNQIQIEKRADVQSFFWLDGEASTELEGEDITLEKNGIVRMGKGKVMIKEIEKSSAVQLASQTEDLNRSEKNKVSLVAEQKLDFESDLSNEVSKPGYNVILYISVALIILIFLYLWWIKKRIK